MNLLRVLIAMHEARNVTQAAEMLGMSQSGFSTALMRLRKQFSDELFIRSGGAMMPTSRAQAMLAPALEVLDTVHQKILRQPAFDPATTQTEFRIAMADVAEFIYLPKLLRHVAAQAPGALITTDLPSDDRLKSQMSEGHVDLAIGYFPDLSTQQFFKQRIYTHTYACIARRGHPIGERLSLQAYEQYGHAVTVTPSRSTALLNKYLQQKGIHRRICLQTPHHLVLPVVVANSDLIATVPRAVAELFATREDIQVLKLPFTPPTFLVQQHWHRSVHKDPRSVWLRKQMFQLFANV